MEISKLQDAYGRHPLVRRLTQVLQRDAVRRICVSGLQGSAAPLLFSSLAARSPQLLGVPFLFVLSDEEEAAYFYQDLMQVLGDANVLGFNGEPRVAVRPSVTDVEIVDQVISWVLDPHSVIALTFGVETPSTPRNPES